MSDLNSTPRGVRVHIAFFGKSNAGKSSLINAITGQNTAIVSDVKGTTTDPVYKSMEILPIGACVIIDTAGLDDSTNLAQQRTDKTLEVLAKTDIAVYVADGFAELDDNDISNIKLLQSKNIPVIIAINKTDIASKPNIPKEIKAPIVYVSALTLSGIEELKKAIIENIPKGEDRFKIVSDLISPGDFVVLVTPIDAAAPKGRIILPQQQVIRDILDSGGISIVTKETGLHHVLSSLTVKPKMVITDSQVFEQVAKDTPLDIPLTSFSILFARAKGDLAELVRGAAAVAHLKDGDKILIAEACTHHKQEDDIATVKIPNWLTAKTEKNLVFEYTSGAEYKKNLEEYALIIHCGACMINRKQMLDRIEIASNVKIPIVNYGVLIAYITGILERVLEPFPVEKALWEKIKPK